MSSIPSQSYSRIDKPASCIHSNSLSVQFLMRVNKKILALKCGLTKWGRQEKNVYSSFCRSSAIQLSHSPNTVITTGKAVHASLIGHSLRIAESIVCRHRAPVYSRLLPPIHEQYWRAAFFSVCIRHSPFRGSSVLLNDRTVVGSRVSEWLSPWAAKKRSSAGLHCLPQFVLSAPQLRVLKKPVSANVYFFILSSLIALMVFHYISSLAQLSAVFSRFSFLFYSLVRTAAEQKMSWCINKLVATE